MIIHLVSKIGFITNDAVTNLKLLEKGLRKEQLSLAVLIDFPFEILFGYYAAKWSTGSKPLRPWLLAFGGRLAAAVLGMALVYFMPSEVGTGYFILVILGHVFGSFMSTVQFVSASAFHTQIADPLIGGTYMTLLNTLSNLGGTWPKYFVLRGVDRFTKHVCQMQSTDTPMFGAEYAEEKIKCANLGGKRIIIRDGYFVMNTLGVLLSLCIFLAFVRPQILRLQSLPLKVWKISK